MLQVWERGCCAHAGQEDGEAGLGMQVSFPGLGAVASASEVLAPLQNKQFCENGNIYLSLNKHIFEYLFSQIS